MNTFEETLGEISILEKEIDNAESEFYRRHNKDLKRLKKLKNRLTLLCIHPYEQRTQHRHYDNGVDQPMRTPSLWWTETCNVCGAVVRMKGDRGTDDWTDLPVGATNTGYGVAVGHGVYTYPPKNWPKGELK